MTLGIPSGQQSLSENFFSELPTDLVHEVFRRLDLRSLESCSKVSKAMRERVQTDFSGPFLLATFAFSLFRQARAAADQLTPEVKAHLLISILECQSHEDAQTAFSSAKIAVDSVTDIIKKDELLGRIAGVYFTRGNTSAAEEMLDQINWKSHYIIALTEIAMAELHRGRSEEAECLLVLAKQARESQMDVRAITKAEALSGDRQAARMLADQFALPKEQSQQLASLVENRIRKNQIRKAQSLICLMKDNYWKAWAFVRMAEVWLKKGDLKLAQAKFSLAETADPGEEIRADIARVEARAGNETRAMQLAASIHDVFIQKSVQGDIALAACSVRLKRGALNEAMEVAAGIKDPYINVCARIKIAAFQVRLKQEKEAEATLSQAERLILDINESQKVTLAARIAILKGQVGRMEALPEILERAENLDYKVVVLCARALAASRLRKREEAREILMQIALEKRPHRLSDMGKWILDIAEKGKAGKKLFQRLADPSS